MAEISLHFEVAGAGSAELERTAQALQKHLAQLPGVRNADIVEAGGTRLTGAEVVAGIGICIALVRSGRILIEELRKLIEEFRKFRDGLNTGAVQPVAQAQSVQSSDSSNTTPIRITNFVLDIGLRSVPLAEMTENDLQELASELKEE